MSTNDISSANWRIWKTIQKLEDSIPNHFNSELATQIVSILREWGEKWDGDETWMHLLNKGKLFHEIEESIVAIDYLLKGTDDNEDFIVLDVCAGKGLFSFLLSYLRHPKIVRIVMLEKAAINWHHIEEGNKTAELEGRPEICIWDNTNLHEYDLVLDRVIDLSYPVALSGIHLCKQLGPSFCGLVNGLGDRCIYACLTPCCMPRAVTAQKNNTKKRRFTLSIQLEETTEGRQARKDYMARRERLRRKPQGGPCFHCHDKNHGLRECPILPTLEKDEQISIRQAWHAAIVPCWNCLQFGHFKNECPAIKAGGEVKCSSRHHSLLPPALCLDVSNVLKTSRPYSAYCNLLAGSFQMNHHKVVKVLETELEKDGKHQEGNWNSERKAIFILVK